MTPAFLPATELLQRIRQRQIGCRELLELYIRRIESHDGAINAVVVREFAAARARADQADTALSKGLALGPLHGLPMTVKESFQLRGTPTTFGLTPFRNNIANRNATAVDRLIAAGAIIFGKTNVPPGLMDGQSDNDIYGRTNNPWNLDRTPGGSSGGSAAALSAGLTGLELGSDIASSIRNPAHFCGVFGHKPTYGICPTAGHSLSDTDAFTDIAVAGPLARSAEDLELALSVLAGPDGAAAAAYSFDLPPSRSRDLRDFRVAVVLDDPFAEVDRTVQDQLSAVARFLDSEGAHVSVGARPPFDSEELYHLYMILLRSATSLAMTDDEYERETANARGYDRATRNVERTNSYGATLSHRDWLRFDLERRRYRAQWNTFFEQFDVLLCLVFGLSLSVASTVVLLRALEQRNAVTSPEGRIAVGWLIVEDLAMVFALVLLPAFAELLDGRAGGTHASLWISLGWTLGKVTLFVAAALVIGTRLVPWMLAQVARTGSRELFTLSVLAVALGIATGSAILFDVSFALGAFFAGVILSESDLSHKAAEDSLPLQNAFAVLFFVSVGMLFDPGILVREPWAVLNVVLVIVVGKSLAAFLIVLAFRFPMETALTVSASLAQIGEFSFILAGLGMALGLLPPEAQNLILAGAILSIALNPIVFAAIGPLLRVLRTSPRVAGILERRSAPAGPSSTELLPPMKGHAIVVGHGRVGGDITPVLRLEGLPFVVIERDRRTYEDLRAGGVRAVYGDASARGVLQLADVGSARILVIASPDGYQTRRILELSRAANPDIQTIVRTHSETELEYLKRQHVGFVLMAERELALRLTEHILRGFGVPPARARQLVEPDVSVPAPVAQGRSSPQRHR